MITETDLPINMQFRWEGELVPDGFSCTMHKPIPYEPGQEDFRYRFHVILQHTLPDGTVVRFRIAVQKESGADPGTWSVQRLVKTHDSSQT